MKPITIETRTRLETTPCCGRPITIATERHKCICRHLEGAQRVSNGVGRAWVEPDGTLVLMMEAK